MNSLQNLNLKLFYLINSTFGKPYLVPFFEFLNIVGEPKNFIIHFIFACIIALSLFFYYKKDKNQLSMFLTNSFVCATAAFFSLLIGFAFLTTMLKYYTGVTRPFCALKDIHIIVSSTASAKCFTSFPSGHLAYCTIIISSFWPLLNKFFKYISIIFIVALAISRIASGNHFPIDIIGAIGITLPLSLYIRILSYEFMTKLNNKTNFISKILN